MRLPLPAGVTVRSGLDDVTPGRRAYRLRNCGPTHLTVHGGGAWKP
jgi:hypothetical protein